MKITKYSPIATRTPYGIFDDMNQIINSMTNYNLKERSAVGEWIPNFEIRRNKNEYSISAELPGLSKKDIDVSISEGILTVKGERKADENLNPENFLRREISYGTFERSFVLSENVDPDKISAEFKNGILKLTIPKVDPPKPEIKQIVIK